MEIKNVGAQGLQGVSFQKQAIRNAQTIGAEKQIKKTDTELKSEKATNVPSHEEFISSGQHTGELSRTARTEARDTTSPASTSVEDTTTEKPAQEEKTPEEKYIEARKELEAKSQALDQKLQELNDQQREREKAWQSYHEKEREDMETHLLQLYLEHQKAEMQRIEMFFKYMDEIHQIQDRMWINRMAAEDATHEALIKALG